ncbi:MAG: hypothetical protein Q7U14_11555, partial [Lacisediminimonas sp.]|nr:hypothetical protein [Lacisediminimonas sp.]
QMRLALMLPLAGMAYLLSVTIGGVPASLALVLILRRASEWIGEIGISQHERLNQQNFAQRTVFLEASSFLLCIVLTIGFGLDLAASAIAWALTPLVSALGARLSLRASRLSEIYALLPHVGSTAIIGISVYVFRISVALLVSKVAAGELFTAFAIGGIIPTIFGQALAPTLLRRFGPAVMRSWWLAAFPVAMLLVAGVTIMLAITQPAWLIQLGHSSTFWMATALSIAGGAIMTVATLLRARLIHSDQEEVFGPDLLSNILTVISIPLIYFAIGMHSMAGLYLLSAILNLVCLWGATASKYIGEPILRRFLFAIGLLLVCPIFFQLDGNLFRSPDMYFDANAQILRLPIPISFLALFAGIAMLGNYAAAKRSLTTIFFTMLLFVASVLGLAAGNAVDEGGKLVLLAQFLFPIFGLVLGEMYGAVARGPIFERASLWILLLILPAQLLAGWFAGQLDAAPLVFFFSIYQHRLYFPTIVATLLIMISFALWGRSGWTRIGIACLIPIALVQLVASGSVNALAAAVTGLTGVMIFHWRGSRYRWQFAAIVLVALLSGTAYSVLRDAHKLADQGAQALIQPPALHGQAATTWSISAATTQARNDQWRFFADEIIASPSAFLLGHQTLPDRSLHPSAHNYWLDAMYSFGVMAILPLIALLVMTAGLAWKRRRALCSNPALFGTAAAAGYLVMIESMFNVGMRQPYPGIIAFFILGLLLARLKYEATPKSRTNP